jgi:hypothetical protein
MERLPSFSLVGTTVYSAVGRPFDGFRPKGIVRRLAYNIVMKPIEAIGRGDQLIVVLEKRNAV